MRDLDKKSHDGFLATVFYGRDKPAAKMLAKSYEGNMSDSDILSIGGSKVNY